MAQLHERYDDDDDDDDDDIIRSVLCYIGCTVFCKNDPYLEKKL